MFITEREQKVTKDVKEWEMEIQLNTIEINNFLKIETFHVYTPA